MRKRITNGKVYQKGEFRDTDLVMDNGKICSIGNTGNFQGETYDAGGNYVVPGFIDIHTHGGAGVDVNGADGAGLEKIGHFFAMEGTTSWLCSILTDTKEQTSWCIEQFHSHKKHNENCANLMGIHLEGPFLEAEYKGAMPEHLLQKGSLGLVEEYQKLAKGNIRYITVSPKVNGVPEMIHSLKEMGIVTAIGHSGADYETAMECIQAGAAAATHTFNAMKLMHQHFPAIAGAVLESDVYCEAICDGRHLHPAVVRLLLKTKGLDRVVAITDSIMAAGLPDGNYKLGVNDVVVADGDARLANGGSRAGSTLTTGQALKNLIQFTQRPIEELLPLLTENPAKLIGEFHRIGSIEEGKDGDLVILNSGFAVVDTFVKGAKIIRTPF